MNRRSLEEWDGAVVVALGGNLPAEHTTVQALLEAAALRLGPEGLRVVARSSWWRSAAWPDPSEPPYLNAVALVETDLDPEATLAALHRVEDAFGRRRTRPNAPRPLDLDLIAHGRHVYQGAGEGALTLPHPRAHERLFVMGPLAEIAPQWRHPVLGRTAAELVAKASVGADARPISALQV